jgi:hypothetical protein
MRFTVVGENPFGKFITKFTVVPDTIGAVMKAHSPPTSTFVALLFASLTLLKETTFPERVRLFVELYTTAGVVELLLIGFIDRTEEPIGPGGPGTEEPTLVKLAIETLTLDGNIPNITAPYRGLSKGPTLDI